MECPKCGNKMVLKGSDASADGKGKQYARKVYRCAAEDVWVTVEVPKTAPKKKPTKR